MHYRLKCSICGALYEDDGFLLQCPEPHAPALLSAVYSTNRLECDPDAQGMYRYRCWLPISRSLAYAPLPATYRSERLAAVLDLSELWIAFSGYWPQKGASLETATFKDFEAVTVLSRVPTQTSRVLVLASAGNTAAAFAWSCAENHLPCLIVVPESGAAKLRFRKPLPSWVKIVCLAEPAVYSDAIAFVNFISRLDGFFCEGGFKNIGRRAGIGVPMLHAAETIGRLPDYYFQAIGSGAGAIAAHEAATKLIADGRFGDKLPQLMLSQNLPFTPIYDAWKMGSRDLPSVNGNSARALIQQMIAPVLSNQQPPYGISGGVFDVLTESQGDMLIADNQEALRAMRLFKEVEGIDIDAAAGVALASLIQARRSNQVHRDSAILLHITGGGWCQRAAEHRLFSAVPDMTIPLASLYAPENLDMIATLWEGCKPISDPSKRNSAAA